MIIAAAALMVIAGVGAAVWLYNTTEVPEEAAVATAQTSRVYFADGKTEMGAFSEFDRTIVESDQISQHVKDAVVASEDSSFYENRGVSPRGIIRALINNLSGGARQGGSTITQQYVERYHTGTTTSYLGKVKEMVMALKIDQELSKDEILTRYLNTIYFGRGAYGIQEASQAYFGKDAADLNESEAALLVAVIPGPSAYDPAKNPEKAATLWSRVIERQVNETQTLTAQEADALDFPETIEPKKTNLYGGTNGYLLKAVHDELLKNGLTEDQINTGGYTIVSTIDPAIQNNTVETINALGKRPERNRVGTVTLDPATGAIRAMYGGPDYVSQSYNDATESRMQAGSIFKTFTLIALLEDGYPLSSRWDGNSPASFRGGWTVKNFNDTSYGRVSLEKATASSINTAYAEANLEIGPSRTRETAVKLGLPENTPGLDDEAPNVLGTASPTVLEMAEVYQSIATKGVHRPAYIVQKVTQGKDTVAYEHKNAEKRVLDEEVAINATVALQGPPSTGSARDLKKIMDGRPVAGKTGTSESFRSAWFVGFTPQLVTAVGMFQPTADGKGEEPLTPFGGEDYITGSTFPTEIWGNIMARSLEGQEELDFPEKVRLDNQRRVSTPKSSEDSQKRPSRPTTEPPADSDAPTEEPSEDTPSEQAPPSEEATPSESAPSKAPSQTPKEPTQKPSKKPSKKPEQGDGDSEGGQNGGPGGEKKKPTQPPTEAPQGGGTGRKGSDAAPRTNG